jgi:hypothetical protein
MRIPSRGKEMPKIVLPPSLLVLEVFDRGHFNVEFKWALLGMTFRGLIFSQMVSSEVVMTLLRALP